MSELEQAQKSYRAEVMNEIGERLDDLILSYDSKVLATMLVVKGCGLLRALYNSGLWTEKDIKPILDEAAREVFLPMEKQVKTITIGASTLPS
jgi:hypothetical protein